MRKKWVFILCGILLIIVCIPTIFYIQDRSKIGNTIDSYKNVSVCYNGYYYTKSYGKHYSEDGYYYGRRWQCVEYVKRFYYDAKGHKMPDLYGNAKDYFSYDTKQGEMNEQRDLLQFCNGGNVAPKEDDLLVFTDSKYGHVAIITEVTEDNIEVIQQNVYGKTRQRFDLTVSDGNYYVGTDKKQPAGWLRTELK
nr:CHAP domain-containing protein [uncultured Clostridium sp.]